MSGHFGDYHDLDFVISVAHSIACSCSGFPPLHSTEMATQPLVQEGASDTPDDLESVTDHAEVDSAEEVLSTPLSKVARSELTVTPSTSSSNVTAPSPDEGVDMDRVKEEVQMTEQCDSVVRSSMLHWWQTKDRWLHFSGMPKTYASAMTC